MVSVGAVTRVLLGKYVFCNTRVAAISNTGLVKFYSAGSYVNLYAYVEQNKRRNIVLILRTLCAFVKLKNEVCIYIQYVCNTWLYLLLIPFSLVICLGIIDFTIVLINLKNKMNIKKIS